MSYIKIIDLIIFVQPANIHAGDNIYMYVYIRSPIISAWMSVFESLTGVIRNLEILIEKYLINLQRQTGLTKFYRNNFRLHPKR